MIIKKDWLLLICLFCLLIMILSGIFAPLLTSFDPNQIDLTVKLENPSLAHLLGTDMLGRDIFARILYGARLTLVLGVALTGIILLVGSLLGFLAAFYKGLVESLIMGFCVLFLSLPSEMLSLIIIALIGPNFLGLVLAIVLSKWPWYVQMVKNDTDKILASHYVDFSKIVGKSKVWILAHHVLPNILSNLIIYTTMDMGGVIISIASLSFIGIGIQAPTAEWGRMLSDAGESAVSYPWQMVPAGVMIFLVTLALNYIGDAIRRREA